jgi:hypothetical protein
LGRWMATSMMEEVSSHKIATIGNDGVSSQTNF